MNDYKIVAEYVTIKNLITKTYPSGIVSLVCDSFDFWSVITVILPKLKEEILARDGRVVIRPDSGDPADIICGVSRKSGTWSKTIDNKYYHSTNGFIHDIALYEVPEHIYKGAYEMLWETFGGEINDKGYKMLNPKIGLIYGDSINYDREKDVLHRLELKKFAASNLVLGIGSFTYEYVTRDTYGFAMKATYGEVDGIGREIYKSPKTDSGLKKSAKGLLKVDYDVNGKITLYDQVTPEQEQTGLLRDVFEDGKLLVNETFEIIRNRLHS